jgi:hypothetical protein
VITVPVLVLDYLLEVFIVVGPDTEAAELLCAVIVKVRSLNG